MNIDKDSVQSLLGRQVRVYVREGVISKVKTDESIEVDIIGYTKLDSPRYVLFGSKSSNHNGVLASRNSASPNNVYVHNQGEYKYSRPLGLPADVDMVVSHVPSTCRKCGYQNYSGSSNQPDGSYVCRQCQTFCHIFGSTP